MIVGSVANYHLSESAGLHILRLMKVGTTQSMTESIVMPGSENPKQVSQVGRAEKFAEGTQNVRPPSPEALKRLDQFAGLLGRVRAFAVMMRDPDYRLPTRLRIMIPLTVAYILWPLDLLPWVVFLLFGLVDDLALLGMTLFLINSEIERYLAEKKKADNAEIIDAEFEEVIAKSGAAEGAPRRS
jgi:uncharacterized membrane protein YkvA (DUF1232 family)